MALLDTIKGWFSKGPKDATKKGIDERRVSVSTMEHKFEEEDLVGAAKDLKTLLEAYGEGKKKNHRNKGREFIYFILSNKHKDLKSTGYLHWKNVMQIINLNQKKVYPYHKNNLRNAIDFFRKEVKSINGFDLYLDK